MLLRNTCTASRALGGLQSNLRRLVKPPSTRITYKQPGKKFFIRSITVIPTNCTTCNQALVGGNTEHPSANMPNEIPEVPSGCEDELQLLQALTSIPLINKALVRPAGGERVTIKVRCMPPTSLVRSPNFYASLQVSDGILSAWWELEVISTLHRLLVWALPSHHST